MERDTSVALGYFDGVHLGHQAVIQASKQCGNLLSAVFTFSTRTSRPASKPAHAGLMSEAFKESMLEQLGVSCMVCPDFEMFRGLTPEQFVEQVLCQRMRAKAVYCGYNFHFGRNASGSTDDLKRLGQTYGIEVHVVERLERGGEPVSSSRIREEVKSGNMPKARELLGRPFTIDFTVVRGRQLGRTLESPTINQLIPDYFILPKFGVYASTAWVDGAWKPGITNIGIKPTVGSQAPLAETYIFDYDGDLYGQDIPVRLYEFIRPEKKFDSIDALKTGILRDVQTSRMLLKEVLQD